MKISLLSLMKSTVEISVILEFLLFSDPDYEYEGAVIHSIIATENYIPENYIIGTMSRMILTDQETFFIYQ